MARTPPARVADRARRRGAAAAVAVALVAPLRAAGEERAWRLEPLPLASEGARAVAASGERVAVGDARGVLVRTAEARWRRVALRGAVNDLAWAPDGALWVASDAGLARLEGTRLEDRSAAPGEAGGLGVLRVVAAAGGLVVVGTAGGTHWSRDGVRFERVEGLFGDGAAGGLAVEEGDGPAVLWIAAERGLFRAELPADGVAQRVRAERVELPVDLRPALDVRAERGRLLALGRHALVERNGPSRPWLVHRPGLPPGALPARLLDAGGEGLWIATDRGVVEAPAPSGPWRRSPEPAGTAPSLAVARGDPGLLVASTRGLLVGRRLAAAASAGAPSARCDPPVAAVHRAVLAYVDLRGDRVARMWRGVRRRGLLPQVLIDGAWARDTGKSDSYDEAFVSGDTRRLRDHDDSRDHERELALALRWDLGDVLYHPEQVDIAAEARRQIELRDDVLDEVNQIYFDRQRALAAASAAPGTAEGARERLRAEELAAGLDAWTGGWFGAHAGGPCPPVDP